MEQITGIIENIIYKNEANGYTVADIDVEGELVTVVGSLSMLIAGERVRLTGKWKEHASYGRQFAADAVQKLPPDSRDGMIKYLSSGIIKGIGPKTAEKIVDKFGTDTLDVIRFTPERLTEVEGIGESKAVVAAEAFAKEYESQETLIFLQSLGVTLDMAVRIYKAYGENTREIVRTEPYRLAEDIEGIGFIRADRIAMALGGAIDAISRNIAALKFILSDAAQSEGHTCLPQNELVLKAVKLLGVKENEVLQGIQKALINRDLVLRRRDNEQFYGLPAYDRAERQIAERLLKIAQNGTALYGYDIDAALGKVSEFSGIELSQEQREAVTDALTGGVTVITGGPGTGKTTTIKCILSAMEQMGLKIELAAPTGRAAKRMSQATGREAKTIHRLLEFGYSGEGSLPSFGRDRENPLECDALIIDEMSMVDIFLMKSVLAALPDCACLLLVGDADQLPSVGAGNVLGDIIASGVVKTVYLREIFRQAKSSLIVMNAHKVNNGEYPELDDKASDFFFDRKSDSEGVLNTVIEMVSTRIPQYLGCDPVRDIQVLAPMKKGDLGIENLNMMLRRQLNPEHPFKTQCELRGVIYRENDKVMQLKNDYNIKWRRPLPGGAEEKGEGLYNGDIGFIESISVVERTMCICFDDNKYADYEFEQADELMLAYAATIHKSQGSEFDVVILPLLKGPQPLMNRNLLYTAITRAKKMVVIVGDKNCVYRMVDNNRIANRYTALKYILNSIQ